MKQASSIVLLLDIGFLLGFRVHVSVVEALAAVVLILIMALAFSWVTISIGLIARSPEQTQLCAFAFLFPVSFVSGVFVPAETMPARMQLVAEANPISVLADAVRGMLLGDEHLGDVLTSELTTRTASEDRLATGDVFDGKVGASIP